MRIVLLILGLSLVGCSGAKKASEVGSTYVPASTYSHLSCDQLIREAEILRARTPALAAAVDDHRGDQTAVEAVTWILFWPAAFALDDGSEQSQELANAKGQLEAIQMNLRSNCS